MDRQTDRKMDQQTRMDGWTHLLIEMQRRIQKRRPKKEGGKDAKKVSQNMVILRRSKKKDAPLKADFYSLPVVGETKLKKGFKALVFSFHSQRRATL